MKRLLVVFFCIPFAALSQRHLTAKDLISLRDRMTGHFTSEKQAMSDSVNFMNIHLRMAVIHRLSNEPGYWLYVEQAAAKSLDKPYRQRIYFLYLFNDTTIASQVYELPDPLRFAGAWNNTAVLRHLTKDSLIAREGCAIYLVRNSKGDFLGSTPGKECKSSLRGAAYATSEAYIYKDRMITWDRGWDDADKQVWGAAKGGYEFVKQK